jgi:hypothetical protein
LLLLLLLVLLICGRSGCSCGGGQSIHSGSANANRAATIVVEHKMGWWRMRPNLCRLMVELGWRKMVGEKLEFMNYLIFKMLNLFLNVNLNNFFLNIFVN